ncbi:DUF5625 family protein [Candidatus Symbiopectobacterium sp. NZEC135]|uniref:DUF5625 family protein n=1 Tax=Candidatus Symbiopectobacterium sp. NZEC135 TaxID=2820471 RepID=UPI0022279265|nr:DUF5625 family protein [Candidatus Symbiopectobacterium sp. NZEC135]MCW2479668.1 hypothetical protein [Candidatus Symbiopectobacterium sp. NZEC135]
MKYTMSVQALKQWRNAVLMMACFWLVACTDPLSIKQPIDVTCSGQSVRFDFTIHKMGDYQFALLFENWINHEEMLRRTALIGDLHKNGVVIPVALNLVKDGRVYFDDEMKTVGSWWSYSFFFQGRRVSTDGRNIKILSLSPGHYSATITILKGAADFRGVDSFVHVSYYEPKI